MVSSIYKNINNHYWVNFAEKAEIPLIIYSANYKPIFYNKFFNQIFSQFSESKTFIDIPKLQEQSKYYSYKSHNNTILKLRFDLALNDNLHYFITVRIVDYIYKQIMSENSLPLSIYTKDTFGVYVEANRYTSSLTQYQSIDGLSHFDIFEENANQLEENDKLTISKGNDIFYEKIFDETFLSLKFKHNIKNENYICAVSINLSKTHHKEINQMLSYSASPDIKIDLTNAELKCLNHFINGKTAKQTATDLNISSKTVEFHLANSKRKLNCFKTTKLAYTIGRYHSLFRI